MVIGETRDGVTLRPRRSSDAEQLGGDGPALAFDVHEVGSMVGSVTLVAVDPPHHQGLGYWLAEAAQLSATDIDAGVTLGNERSVGVLTRDGFEVTEVFADDDRFHLALR